MTRFVFSIVLSLAIFGAAWAEDYQDEVTEFRLDNGLHIVVVENHRAPIVNHMVWFDVGASDETPGKSGLAHLVEHLMFEGTQRREPGEFDRIIKSLGGSSNAFTGQEYSAYTTRVFNEHLEAVMELEADRMMGVLFEADSFERERDVVLEERHERVDSNPHSLFGEQMEAALFQNHPYGIPTIGWRHEIEALTLADVKEFYQEYYHPQNATLVVSGDVEPQKTFELAAKHFGHLRSPEGFESKIQLAEPPHNAERRVLMKDPRVSTPYIFRKYLIPKEYSSVEENLAAIAVMTNMLGGRDLTSALSESLELTNIATYSAAGFEGDTTGPVIVNMYLVPTSAYTLAEAEAKLDEVLAEFATRPVDPDHLDRIRADIKYNAIYDRDDSMNAGFKYGSGLVSGLTIEQIERWDGTLRAVDEEQIALAARFLLSKKLSVTGWLEPAKEN